MKPLVLYHKNCMDGAGAALAAWLKFGAEADYLPAQYGDDPRSFHEQARGRDVYLLDFSFKRDDLFQLLALAPEHQLTVIDHHETAQAELQGISCCIFDMNKSGARLAWEHFHPSKPVPELIQYIEDRDLWRWRMPESKEMSLALAARGCHLDFMKLAPFVEEITKLDGDPDVAVHADVFAAAGAMHPQDRERLLEEGRAIMAYQQTTIAQICAHAREVVVAGHRVLAVNSPVLQSEVGEQLAQGRPFGLVYYFNDKGHKVVSLRSRAPSDINVAEIARGFGGGGHARAAGYTERF